MKPGKSRGNWLLIASLAGLAAGYLVLVFLPSQRTAGRLKEELAAKQDFVAQSDAMLPAVRVTEQQLEKAKKFNARWLDAAPSETESAGLFGKLHATAKAAGIATTRFDPQPPIQYEKVRLMNIAVGYTGSFAQICRFLADLEDLPQTIWINSLQIESGGRFGKDAHCELNLAVFVDKSDESDQVKGSG